ncbi:PaaI family thioesterase [Alkalimarinus sediminis]|uniref:PaaI family thioesterase n=1 Tax=Alkalimarinus sediminis TaxID=1632866 RepID=A0A9E8HL37_9ALTE|nr:PaaI family thioesterase [Alkalimarinus sediminis]UZW76633.1 PaaI family thioesterase [Alkalimarinus sediminis]
MKNDPVLFGQVSRFVGSLAQCSELGIKPVLAASNVLTLELPYSQSIIGNPDTGVIHGGAITTLMDTASGSVVICGLDEFELCPTLDLRVDYMHAAEPGKPVFAKATCYKITKNIIFTRCIAYQDSDEEPVAQCVATFMRIGAEATPLSFRQMVMGAQSGGGKGTNSGAKSAAKSGTEQKGQE